MPFLDRTNEIQSIIQNQQQKKQYEQAEQTTINKTLKKKKQDKDVTVTQFNDKARQVSKELQETADLLQKLTKLVKKKTPFDDNSELIKSLTLKVKEQLSNQDYSLRSLQEIVDKKQEKKNQQTQHSTQIITGLNSKLLYATEQFQNVLKTRTTQMKTDKKRRNMYTFESGVKSISSLTAAASPINGNQSGSNMMAAGSSSDDPSIQTEKIDELLSEGSQTLQQANASTINRNVLASRTDDILSIEREVEKLGGMFNHLAVMIKHHGELTQRIDQNLTTASHDLEQGNKELWDVWENTRGNTGLILKIFGVLVIFIILVGLLVVR